MARLYGNENFPLPVIEELRRLEHDIQTIQETGKRAATDEEVLAFAISEGRAVLTLNRKHFLRLHHDHPQHSGIILCTFDPDFAGQAARIHAVIAAQEQLAGHLLRVNRPAR
jgi:predicted nuclease of predicted toxin-antitoxin system